MLAWPPYWGETILSLFRAILTRAIEQYVGVTTAGTWTLPESDAILNIVQHLRLDHTSVDLGPDVWTKETSRAGLLKLPQIIHGID